jgi:hypothetical protein
MYILSLLSKIHDPSAFREYTRKLRRGIFRYPFRPFRVNSGGKAKECFVMPGDHAHDVYKLIEGPSVSEHRGYVEGEGCVFVVSPDILEAAARSAEEDTDWCYERIASKI